MADFRRRFAQNLIEQRERHGRGPEELAERASIPVAQLRSFENAEEEPDLKALVKLAGSLAVSVEILIAGLT